MFYSHTHTGSRLSPVEQSVMLLPVAWCFLLFSVCILFCRSSNVFITFPFSFSFLVLRKDNNSSWEPFQSGEYDRSVILECKLCIIKYQEEMYIKAFGNHSKTFVSKGGRGSYSDIGGPVITTQVTIPKDVSAQNI